MRQAWPEFRLDGKVALVTGGSRGIGRRLGLSFAEAGCAVMLAARDANPLTEVEKELRAVSSQVATLQCDVTHSDQVKALVDATVRRFGTIHILVNNAGILGPIGPTWENDAKQWEETIRVNLVGTYLCCREVLPVFLSRGSGKIINLAGGGAAFPWPRFSAYSASKAAVVRFTETLAAEVKDHHIQVNVMAPGANDTEMFRKAAEAEPRLLADLPGDTLKPARLACFLASEASDHITGRFIHVDQNWDEWTESDLAGDRFTLRRV